MVLRRPKPGQSWDAFWGCNRFPDCKGTMNIDPTNGKPYSKYDDYSDGDGWDGFEGE